MKPLQTRKQLLLAESELNRAQLVGEMAELTAEVRALTGRAKSIGLIASSATTLLVGLAAFLPKKSGTAGEKPGWLRTILHGAGLVSSLWRAFRPKEREQRDE